MYLYRAINKVDEEKYCKGEDITCNLIRHQDLDYIKKEVFFVFMSNYNNRRDKWTKNL